jgi:hypothetical protein
MSYSLIRGLDVLRNAKRRILELPVGIQDNNTKINLDRMIEKRNGHL